MGASAFHIPDHASSGIYPAVDGSAVASTGNAPTLYDVNTLTPSARASRMFKAALDAGGLSYAAAGDVLGVSPQRVASKCHPARVDAPVTVSDALALLDGGKAEAVASLIRSLQAELDEATGRAAGVRPASVGVVAIQLCARGRSRGGRQRCLRRRGDYGRCGVTDPRATRSALQGDHVIPAIDRWFAKGEPLSRWSRRRWRMRRGTLAEIVVAKRLLVEAGRLLGESDQALKDSAQVIAGMLNDKKTATAAKDR